MPSSFLEHSKRSALLRNTNDADWDFRSVQSFAFGASTYCDGAGVSLARKIAFSIMDGVLDWANRGAVLLISSGNFISCAPGPGTWLLRS